MAYKNAILDGADVIDCYVQMTKDGIPICLESINLIDSTTVAKTDFNSLLKSVPELGGNGVYTFDLGWTDIQGLTREFPIQYTSGSQFIIIKLNTKANHVLRSLKQQLLDKIAISLTIIICFH